MPSQKKNAYVNVQWVFIISNKLTNHFQRSQFFISNMVTINRCNTVVKRISLELSVIFEGKSSRNEIV